MTSLLHMLVHNCIPPGLVRFMKRISGRGSAFQGNFSVWHDAVRVSSGYNSDQILYRVRDSLLKVKKGEAVYERDSVLFEQIQYAWPLLAGLLWIASRHSNTLNVLDYGGSLGSSYYQNRNFLCHLESLHWNIVEQPQFVKCGKSEFEDESLHFFDSVDDCLREESPDVLLLGSVLQYLEHPYATLNELMDSGIDYIIIDRTPFVLDGPERLTVQTVPPDIYPASYPAWLFSRSKFVQQVTQRYDLIAEFSSCVDQDTDQISFKGFLLQAKTTC